MTVLTRNSPLALRTLLGASIVCKANMPANHGRPRVHVILNGGGKRLPNLLRFRELRFALYALYMPVAPEPSDVVTPTWSTLQTIVPSHEPVLAALWSVAALAAMRSHAPKVQLRYLLRRAPTSTKLRARIPPDHQKPSRSLRSMVTGPRVCVHTF